MGSGRNVTIKETNTEFSRNWVPVQELSHLTVVYLAS
jgi:hypothetical protein